MILLSGCAAAAGLAVLPLSSGRGRVWGLALLLAGAGGAVSLALMAPHLPASAVPTRYARDAFPHTGLPIQGIESFSGTAAADSTTHPDGSVSFPVRLRQVRSAGSAAQASGLVLVRAAGALRVYRGQELAVRGGLRPARAPGAAAYGSRVRSAEVASGSIGGPLLRRRAGWLAALERGLDRFHPEVSALLAALLLGIRSDVAPALYERFRASGALHLLALSGLHVGILFALLWSLLPFLSRPTLRRLIAVAGVFVYLFLVGVRPSLLRAVLMLLGAAVGAALDREGDPLNLLALAAALVLVLDPWRYADLGCQLSFLSLAGVCLLAPGLTRLLRRWLPRWLAVSLAVSAGAQIGSGPLLLLHFGMLQPVGVIAAVVLIPLVSLYLWAGLAALPLALVGGPALAAADWLLRGAHGLLRVCLGAFARFPPLRLPWRPWFWVPFLLLLAAAALGLPAFTRIQAAERPEGAA